MNILYLRTVFWFGLKAGGSVGHTSGVINALSKHIQVDVVSNDSLADVQPNLTIISPGLLKLIPFRLGEVFYSFALIKKLKKKIRDCNNIYHRYSGLSFAAAYLSRKNNVPLVLEFNSSDAWMLRHWSKQSFLLTSILARVVNLLKIPIVTYIEQYNSKNASLIIIPSAPLKEKLIKKGISEKKILINPNGVDPQTYSPSISGYQIRAKYRLENHNVIGFIGTFAQWHGVVEMARSIELFFQLNRENINEVKFLLVGDGKLMPTVKKIIDRSGCRDNVIFTGLIAQSKGPKHLAACDILLSPHIKNPDGSKFFGSPTKLFEYMAMGKAIIASNLDQIGEVLEHENTAYLVEPGNIKQLADAMQLLIADSKLRKKLGKNARTKVVKKYTWDKHVEKILARLNEIKELG